MATTADEFDDGIGRAVLIGGRAQLMAGAVASVLAVLGIFAVASGYMVTAASVVLGSALIFYAAAVALQFPRILDHGGNGTLAKIVLGIGVLGQIAGGIATMVFGVKGLHEKALLADAAIVLGVTLILGSGILMRLNALPMYAAAAVRGRRRYLKAPTITQFLVGVTAVVLGMFSLTGLAAWLLNGFAMFFAAGVVLLSGGIAATELGGGGGVHLDAPSSMDGS